jgi:hypothetical protein
MKKITLLVIMIVTAFTLNAQSLVKYRGEKTGYPVAFPLSVFRLPDPLLDGGGF